MAASKKRFRIVLRTDSHVRLMEKPGDDPGLWNFNTDDPQFGMTKIFVRDEIRTVGTDVSAHVGLEIVVERNADSLEEAIEKGEHDAAVAMALLSAAGRAPTSDLLLLLAYDVSPGESVRRIRQWFWNPPLVVGKTPVPSDLFGDLFMSFTECKDEKLTWRIGQSLSWHQRGLRESDAVARYMALWIASEALEPRLREHFGVSLESDTGVWDWLKRRGRRRTAVAFPGLKALAASEGSADDVVKRAYTLRNDLFHSRRVTAADLVARASELIPELERLLPSAWATLLGIDERTADFPELSVVPHRVGMFFDAELLEQDERQWAEGNNPYFVGELDAVRVDTGDPREISAEYPTKLQVRNVSGEGGTWRARGLGIVGPSGPNIGTAGFKGEPEVLPGT